MRKIFEQEESPIEPRLIKFFKYLNEVKKEVKTKKNLLEKIKTYLPVMGIDEDMALYLLELYSLNYRKDGNYSEITKQNFIDPRKQKGKTTSNTQAKYYTIAQLPFQGSNLKAFWTKDGKNVPIYIVSSYDWYPIYLFRDNKWYEVTKSYSSSTGRQMRNANPVEWDEKLYDKVYRVTPNEIKRIIQGATFDEIVKMKRESLKKMEPELQKQRVKVLKPYQWYDDYTRGRGQAISIKYKINSVDTEGDKSVVNVDILGVFKRDNYRTSKEPFDYLSGTNELIDKKYVEDKLQQKLKYQFQEFVGPRYNYSDNLSDIHDLKFVFNHLKN